MFSDLEKLAPTQVVRAATLERHESYLASILALIGVPDAAFVRIEGPAIEL